MELILLLYKANKDERKNDKNKKAFLEGRDEVVLRTMPN